MRTTLGIDDIDLYGDSYGTFLAQSYAFRHGDTLRSLVLDSAYPDRGESAWYPSLPRVGVRALRIVCRRSPECSGNAERRLDRAVDELRKTQRGVGPLIDTLINGAFDPPDHYLRVNRAIRELVRGNSAPFDKLTYIGREGYGRLHEYSHAQELFVSCNDYPMLWDKRASEKPSGGSSSSRRWPTIRSTPSPLHPEGDRPLVHDRLPLLPHLPASQRVSTSRRSPATRRLPTSPSSSSPASSTT